MTSTTHRPAPTDGQAPRMPRGVQSVKFTFFKMPGEARRLPQTERTAVAETLLGHLDASGEAMLTRAYTTAGTRGDVDVLLWQVHDDLRVVMDWHEALRASSVGAWLDVPRSYLSMTMRSLYTNPQHEGATSRERLRTDGGTDEFLFVYPMAKTRAWYAQSATERQRMMEEHIAIGHKYHDIKINTTYSYGLDDQEFVVAFEGNDPGQFLALVRELRDTEASAYTLFDTPMFTCRRIPLGAVPAALGLA
ncbi:MAG: chlorite dismutase [Chloroflexi bacterium]|nr:MAG: chlorite dismutase [Chloroflexota bacterium]